MVLSPGPTREPQDGVRCKRRMWLDLRRDQAVRITPGHNIQGAKQPQRGPRAPGPGSRAPGVSVGKPLGALKPFRLHADGNYFLPSIGGKQGAALGLAWLGRLFLAVVSCLPWFLGVGGLVFADWSGPRFG